MNNAPITQAVVLCGGLGTRLGELTRTMPKPLLPLAGRPFLDVLLGELGRHGIRQVLLLAAFHAEQVEAYAAETPAAQKFELSVEVVIEPERAGTAGALAHAFGRLAEQFLLLNGDSWLDMNLLLPAIELAAHHDCDAVLTVRELADASRSGVVTMRDGQVISFRERPDGPGPGLVNGGVYAVRRRAVADFPPIGSLETKVLPRLAAAGRVRAVLCEGYFIDIGVPETYSRSQSEVPLRLTRPAVFLDRDGVLNHDDGHVGSVDRFRWTEDAREAVREINDRGWFAFLVTNQAGVAHGFYRVDDVERLHDWVRSELAQLGAHLDDVRYCPFHPEAARSEWRAAHPWRKPQPGMLLDLIDHWPIDRARSLMIGDRDTDIAAAQAAGIRAARFTGGSLHAFVLDRLTGNGGAS